MNRQLWLVKFKWGIIYLAVFGLVLGIPGVLAVGGTVGTGVDSVDAAGESLMAPIIGEDAEGIAEEFYTSLIIDDVDTAEELVHDESDITREDLERASDSVLFGSAANVADSERQGESGDRVHTRVKIDDYWVSAEMERNDENEWKVIDAELVRQ